MCAGLRRKLSQLNSPEVAPEAVPGGGDFRYVCVGYSAYNSRKLRDAARNRQRHDEPIEVPYCEGLEVISAAAVAGNRELMSEAPLANSSSAASSEESLRRHKADRRTSLPIAGAGEVDWKRFGERFESMSWKLIEKMQANANYMVRSLCRSWDQIWTGGSSRSDK